MGDRLLIDARFGELAEGAADRRHGAVRLVDDAQRRIGEGAGKAIRLGRRRAAVEIDFQLFAQRFHRRFKQHAQPIHRLAAVAARLKVFSTASCDTMSVSPKA
jgi:hypothetical protein